MEGTKEHGVTTASQQIESCLGLARVLAPVLAVNALEVVAARPDVVE